MILKEFNYSLSIIVLLFLYLGTVYFSMATPNIILGIIIFIFVLGLFTNKLQLDFTKKKWLIYLLVCVPLLLTIISVLNSAHIFKSLKYIWIRMPILVIPFILIFMDYKKKDVKTGLKFFVICTVLASLITLYNAIKYFNEGLLFKTDFTHFITIIQHPYLGVFTLIALITTIELELVKSKTIKTLISLLLVLTIILTTSRLVYIVLMVYSCYFLYTNLSKKLFLGLGSLLIILAITFLALNPKIYNKFKSVGDYDKSPRLQLWNNALEVIKKEDAYLFGIGIGDYYVNKKDPYFAKGRGTGTLGFNPHSQILEFYTTNGFLGVLTLVFSFIVFAYFLIGQEDHAIFLFTIIFLFSLIECIFSRQFGVQLYCIVIPIALSENFKIKRGEIT